MLAADRRPGSGASDPAGAGGDDEEPVGAHGDGDPDTGIPAIVRGLHFHDLRHSHKTWLIEDDVPEVAQAKRLGHRLPGVRGIYSHVSATVEQRLVDGLQKRWEQTTPPQPPKSRP